MEPTYTLSLDGLTVETFATQENLSSPSIVETGCVMPCEQKDVWW